MKDHEILALKMTNKINKKGKDLVGDKNLHFYCDTEKSSQDKIVFCTRLYKTLSNGNVKGKPLSTNIFYYRFKENDRFELFLLMFYEITKSLIMAAESEKLK